MQPMCSYFARVNRIDTLHAFFSFKCPRNFIDRDPQLAKFDNEWRTNERHDIIETSICVCILDWYEITDSDQEDLEL